MSILFRKLWHTNGEVTGIRKWREKQVFLLHFSRFFVTLQDFSAFLCIKAVWGDRGKTGLRIGNRTLFHILLWIAFKERPMMCHQPYYDSSSGAKVIILFERNKSWLNFLFWACSSLLNWLRHLLWHQPEKCVLGYVLLLILIRIILMFRFILLPLHT